MFLINIRNAILITICVVLFIPPVVDAITGHLKANSPCQVLMVSDGDTVKMYCETLGVVNGRILGYDTPEKNARCIQEYVAATRATWALRGMLWKASEHTITRTKQDRYGRELITVTLGNQDVSKRMINAGYARPYRGGKRPGWCGK